MAKKPVKVETLTHDDAARRNIPTAEYQSVAERIEEQQPDGAGALRARDVRWPRARRASATTTSIRRSSGAARASA